MRSYKNFVYPRKKRKANGEKMQKKKKKKIDSLTRDFFSSRKSMVRFLFNVGHLVS